MCKILSRIKVLADNEGITISALEKTIGASRGVISKAITNGTDIQSKWLELICENFRKYSGEWLLTGEGEMLKSEQSSNNIIAEDRIPKNKNKDTNAHSEVIETRPRIPLEAAAGSLSIATQSISEDECEQIPVIPTLPRYDFTIIARGDSMEPQYLSGDELACLFIHEKSFIQWGRTHVLDTVQGIVVKRIFDNGNSILCRSNNSDYPDFSIPKSEIYHMALVVGYIRIE